MPKRQKQLPATHLMDLAKRGAAARLSELVHEAEMLLGLFPSLRASFDPDELPTNFILKRGAQRAERRQTAPRRRKRSGWSAAQRKAAATRMKAYWAKRKAGRKR
jgi:hypothetical protein